VQLTGGDDKVNAAEDLGALDRDVQVTDLEQRCAIGPSARVGRAVR
jgi:hypothetical protein